MGIYDKAKAKSLGGSVGGEVGSLYERAQRNAGLAPESATIDAKPLKIPEAIKSPLYLGDKTTISQAPEKKVPFGALGRMAKAAFDTTVASIDNTAQKFSDLLDSVGRTDDEYPFNDNYQTETGRTLFMSPEERKAFYEDRKKKTTPLNQGLKLGEFGLSLANLYPPIAAFNAELSAAKELPGPLAIPAHAIDLGFQKVSELGTSAMDKGIDHLRDTGTISPETADAIKPFAQELAGFTTLVVGTHLGFKAMEKGLGKGVDVLPVKESTKQNINRGVALGTSLSMQPFSTAFGLTHSMITTKIEQRKAQGIEITPEEGRKIVEEVANDLPIAHSEYLKENKIESFIPDSKLVDSRGKQDLRTVMSNLSEAGYDAKQISTIMQKVYEKNNTGRFTEQEISNEARKFTPVNPPVEPSKIMKGGKEIIYDPKRPVVERPVVEERAPVAQRESTSVAPVERVESERVAPKERRTRVSADQLPVKSPEGETRVSRLEARMKQELDRVSPVRAEAEGISTYKQMNKAEQRRKAAEYVEANPEEAMAVLKGEKTAPEGLLHNSIAMAMEAKAHTEADANLAVKLASLRSTRAGQEISILTEADPTNIYSNINEIIKARTAKAERNLKDKDASKAVKTDVSEAKEVVKKSRLKIEQAESLLEKILC